MCTCNKQSQFATQHCCERGCTKMLPVLLDLKRPMSQIGLLSHASSVCRDPGINTPKHTVLFLRAMINMWLIKPWTLRIILECSLCHDRPIRCEINANHKFNEIPLRLVLHSSSGRNPLNVGGRCAATVLKQLHYFGPQYVIISTLFQAWPKIWCPLSKLSQKGSQLPRNCFNLRKTFEKGFKFSILIKRPFSRDENSKK